MWLDIQTTSEEGAKMEAIIGLTAAKKFCPAISNGAVVGTPVNLSAKRSRNSKHHRGPRVQRDQPSDDIINRL